MTEQIIPLPPAQPAPSRARAQSWRQRQRFAARLARAGRTRETAPVGQHRTHQLHHLARARAQQLQRQRCQVEKLRQCAYDRRDALRAHYDALIAAADKVQVAQLRDQAAAAISACYPGIRALDFAFALTAEAQAGQPTAEPLTTNDSAEDNNPPQIITGLPPVPQFSLAPPSDSPGAALRHIPRRPGAPARPLPHCLI